MRTENWDEIEHQLAEEAQADWFDHCRQHPELPYLVLAFTYSVPIPEDLQKLVADAEAKGLPNPFKEVKYNAHNYD